MKKALSLSTLGLVFLGLVACNNTNDITGINVGKNAPTSVLTLTSAVYDVRPEVVANMISLAHGPHQVAVMAPNQPAPIPHKHSGTPPPTPTPTPTPIP